jgi:hypothetical protein
MRIQAFRVLGLDGSKFTWELDARGKLLDRFKRNPRRQNRFTMDLAGGNPRVAKLVFDRTAENVAPQRSAAPVDGGTAMSTEPASIHEFDPSEELWIDERQFEFREDAFKIS